LINYEIDKVIASPVFDPEGSYVEGRGNPIVGSLLSLRIGFALKGALRRGCGIEDNLTPALSS